METIEQVKAFDFGLFIAYLETDLPLIEVLEIIWSNFNEENFSYYPHVCTSWL